MKISKKLVIGIIFLIAAALCTACLLVNFQKDWIMLIAILISSIVFVTQIKDEVLEKYVQERYSRKVISRVSIILIVVALMILSDFGEKYVSGGAQFCLYFVSFICWMIGLSIRSMST